MAPSAKLDGFDRAILRELQANAPPMTGSFVRRRMAAASATWTGAMRPWRAMDGAPAEHLYVHVPFCAHRCGYCDFVTVTGREHAHGPYVDALLASAGSGIAVGRGKGACGRRWCGVSGHERLVERKLGHRGIANRRSEVERKRDCRGIVDGPARRDGPPWAPTGVRTLPSSSGATRITSEFDSAASSELLLPGRIVIEEFLTPDEAKQKLLALIMAMGNDPDGFDSAITMPDVRTYVR